MKRRELVLVHVVWQQTLLGAVLLHCCESTIHCIVSTLKLFCLAMHPSVCRWDTHKLVCVLFEQISLLGQPRPHHKGNVYFLFTSSAKVQNIRGCDCVC